MFMVQLCEIIQPVNIIHCVAEALTLVTVKAELPEQELVVFCQDKFLVSGLLSSIPHNFGYQDCRFKFLVLEAVLRPKI